MLPVPGRAAAGARRSRAAEGCDRVWFGAAAPLGLLAPPARARARGRVDARPRGRLGAAARRAAGAAPDRPRRRRRDLPRRLHPARGWRRRSAARRGWSSCRAASTPRVFRPGAGGDEVRRAARARRTGPVVVCVSRLVPRKGQDVLIRALPRAAPAGARARRCCSSAAARTCRGCAGWPPSTASPTHVVLDRLGAVGGAAGALRRRRRLRDAVPHPARRAGGRGPRHRLPRGARDRAAGRRRALAAARRTRCSTARPGVVVDGRVAGGRSPTRSPALLADPRPRARRWARAGRAWVEREWRWDVLAARLRGLLAGTS